MEPTPGGDIEMETPLTFDYDEVGDILYISKVPPYPGQETEQLAYNVVARRNPDTGAVENLEVLLHALAAQGRFAATPPPGR
jgi:hypothetical protein